MSRRWRPAGSSGEPIEYLCIRDTNGCATPGRPVGKLAGMDKIDSLTEQYRAVVARINRYPMSPARRAAILAEVLAGYLVEVQTICRRDRAAVDLSSLPQFNLNPVCF